MCASCGTLLLATIAFLSLFKPCQASEHCGNSSKKLGSSTILEFSEGYDLNVIPMGEDGSPAKVKVSIHLRNIYAIDEPEQRLALDITVYTSWTDPRVRLRMKPSSKTDYMMFIREPTSMLWVPDIFFHNAVVVAHPALAFPAHHVRIYNDSRIHLAQRAIISLACQMTFEDYPVDVQVTK